MSRLLQPRGMLLLAGAGFAALALTVLLVGVHPADAAARDSLLALASPAMVALMRVVTYLGHAWFLVPATAALLWFIPEARARWWVWVGLMLLAPAAESVVKVLIGRPRPFDASLGFPSGHATAAAAYFGALFHLAGGLRCPSRAVLRVLAGVAILLVALSRVVLRAHWPSDVLGGIALGLALASAAALLARSARAVDA